MQKSSTNKAGTSTINLNVHITWETLQ